MAIYEINKAGEREVTFAGCVIGERTHFWMDGMMDEYAIVWCEEKGTIENVQTGYVGIDGTNLMGMGYDIDCTPATARKVLKALKKDAYSAFAKHVGEDKHRIEKGCVAEVVRGRKVPAGTVLNVFWVGERETFMSKKHYWLHETESVTGGKTADGEKFYVKTEYLKRLDVPASPCRKERDAFVKAYVRERARAFDVDLFAMARM